MRSISCKSCLFFLVISLFFLTSVTSAQTDETSFGSQIFVSSAARDVIITFGGNEQNPRIELGLLQPDSIIFGSMDELPLNHFRNLKKFRVNDELIFYITNKSDPRCTFFTGPADRNPDKIPHAQIISSATGLRVGFEETYGGGDEDFNDVVFYLSGNLTTIPPRPSIPYLEAGSGEAPVETESSPAENYSPVFFLFMGIILALIFFGYELVQPVNRPQRGQQPRGPPSGMPRPVVLQPIKAQRTEPRYQDPLSPEALPKKTQLIGSHETLSGEPLQIVQAAQESPQSSLDFITIEDIDAMEGKEFEFFLKVFFQKQGYSVEMVPTSRNSGVDLKLKKSGITTVVRVKRQGRPVDPEVVEQAKDAKTPEKADQAWVITNNYYTGEAKESALSSGVKVFDRDNVVAMIGNSPVTRTEFLEKYHIWKSYM